MSELDQLKERIDNAGVAGVLTKHIRDDYEPAGAMMILGLCANGEYSQRKGMRGGLDQKWRIFKAGFEPY